MSGPSYAAPVRAPETEAFWSAVNDGKLLLKKCRNCSKASYYPRTFCPLCFGETDWIEASGAGTIYSYTTVYLRDGSYHVALVTLDEGPTVLTNIVDVPAADLSIGQSVKVSFAQSEGQERVPVFVPVA